MAWVKGNPITGFETGDVGANVAHGSGDFMTENNRLFDTDRSEPTVLIVMQI
jgi:hypothetical protein